MKKLTDTQKKWALTACLASVLSFNMVIGLTHSTYGTASFASGSPDDKDVPVDEDHIKFEPFVNNKGEEIKIKYIQEDDKTIAIVPKKLESGFCFEDCGKKYLLPKNFDASATSLEAALRKAINKDDVKAKPIDADETASAGTDLDKPAKSDKRQNRGRKEVQDDDKDQESPEFASLRENCDKKDDEYQLSCYGNGLVHLLKNKKKTYDREEVLSFFKENVEPKLRAALADVSDLLPRRQRVSRFGLDIDDAAGSMNTRRKDAQDLVESMAAQITGKYNFLRERLAKISANAVLSNQQQAQAMLKQADLLKTSNPQQFLQLQQLGYAHRAAANAVANDLGGSLYDGLDTAQWSNYITGDQFQTMYQTDYANVVNQAIQGMAMNPLTYQIPSVTLADGMTIIDQNGQSFTVTSSTNPLIQKVVNNKNIMVMTNKLTPANVITAGAPQILVGSAGQGTATITPLQATTAVTAPVANAGVARIGGR